MYLQPSLPSIVTHACVIGYAVNASRPVFTFVIDAFVNVEGTIIFRVTGEALANVTVCFVKAASVVFTICIEAKLATDALVMRQIVLL